MRRVTLIALLALGALLYAPTGVLANDLPQGAAFAQRMAAKQFPPACPVAVSVSTVPQQEDADAYADLAGCQVLLSPTTQWNPWKLCVLMTHEYGHLAGLSHSTDPNSIMYPAPSNAPLCNSFFGRMSDLRHAFRSAQRHMGHDHFRASRERWHRRVALLRHQLAVMSGQIAD